LEGARLRPELPQECADQPNLREDHHPRIRYNAVKFSNAYATPSKMETTVKGSLAGEYEHVSLIARGGSTRTNFLMGIASWLNALVFQNRRFRSYFHIECLIFLFQTVFLYERSVQVVETKETHLSNLFLMETATRVASFEISR
jgi:hypothetical protein